jgi:hypothetical protein
MRDPGSRGGSGTVITNPASRPPVRRNSIARGQHFVPSDLGLWPPSWMSEKLGLAWVKPAVIPQDAPWRKQVAEESRQVRPSLLCSSARRLVCVRR